MSRLTVLLLAALVTVATVRTAGSAPAVLTVSLDGELPSLAAARDRLRQLRARGELAEGAVITIKAGEYPISEPVVFSPEDSGTENGPIVFRGEGDVVIHGGLRINGWQEEAGRWVAEIPAVRDGTWHFSALWANGQRRQPARTPNPAHPWGDEPPDSDYFRTAGPVAETDAQGKAVNSSTKFRYHAADIPSHDGLEDARFVIFHSWATSLMRLKELDEENQIVELTGPARWPFGHWQPDQRYFIEHFRGGLDQPGEWYLDRKNGKLHYIPMPGETVDAAEIIAPAVRQLLVLRGDPAQGRFVEHLHFDNLKFHFTEYPIEPQGHSDAQAAFSVDAAVEATAARHCRVTRCQIQHTGNYAVWFRAGCQDNLLQQCELFDLGAGGVRIGEGASPATENEQSLRNTIDNNYIHDGGRIFRSAVGVWIGRSSHNRVTHNEIRDFRYTGVSLGWSWGYAESSAHHNIIENNHIHHIGRGQLNDMGGIYCLGISPGTVLRGNRIHDVDSHPRLYGGWGLYTDEGSSDILIENNLVYRVRTGTFHQHYGRDNRVQNNILAYSQTPQIVRSREEEHNSFFFERNIVYFDNGSLLGSTWKNGNWTMDNNLYWDRRGTPLDFAGRTLEKWQAEGHDRHSLVADPLFVAPESGDFTLQADSPAPTIGFKPFDISKAGLYGDASWAQRPSRWQVVVSPEQQADEAIRTALADLIEQGLAVGLQMVVVSDMDANDAENAIVVGDALRNRHSAKLLRERQLSLPDQPSPEAYCIRTWSSDRGTTLLVAGRSVIGDVHGLYWVWDRLRVYRRIPEIHTDRSPAMAIRFASAWSRHGHAGSSKEHLRRALRSSINWVAGPAVLDLVPWNCEPEATANAENRKQARELIHYAHALHMNYFSFSNDFTYHPSIIEELGASLSPCDPRFWEAVQEKYRRLFTALPELDGVKICNDDLSGFWDHYQVFDLLHDPSDCEWSYPKRFREFVSKVHDVVVGEFDKTYFHFTWGLRESEVHCQPDVFREIFTDEVPIKNLYLMPKITRADRWWHQPYNPTFNLTPHPTIAAFETMNYHEIGGERFFPTFSGQYFQRGLQTILLPEETNLRGLAMGAAFSQEAWDTASAYGYVLYRLAWNPHEPMAEIARDFCAIHFGAEVAEEMSRIFLLSPSAYQYGLHIEPVSYGQFNSLLQLRVGTFPVEGLPAVDGGREHLDFLRRIYLRCKPWQTETLRALQQGRETAESMLEAFHRIQPRFPDAALARQVEERLIMTNRLIHTNIGYVETIFAYFDYWDEPTEARRLVLKETYARLESARADFVNTPGFQYQLLGIDLLMVRAAAVLENLDLAKTSAARQPTRRQILETIASQQAKYGQILDAQQDQAVRLGRFRILIDGQDILVLKDDQFHIEHLKWDGAHVDVGDIQAALPAEAVTVIPRFIESRPLHPFVLEQPSPENEYTARVYLNDQPGGNGWMTFDLFYIPEPPEKLGLALPWGR